MKQPADIKTTPTASVKKEFVLSPRMAKYPDQTLSACLATLLRVPLKSVPRFEREQGRVIDIGLLQKWLRERGVGVKVYNSGQGEFAKHVRRKNCSRFRVQRFITTDFRVRCVVESPRGEEWRPGKQLPPETRRLNCLCFRFL